MIYSDTKVESMKEQLKQYNNEIKELSDSHKEKDKRKNEIHREVEKLNGDIAELEKENRKLDFEKKEIADKHNPLTGKRVELETALEKDAHEKSILAEQMKLPDFWTALATRTRAVPQRLRHRLVLFMHLARPRILAQAMKCIAKRAVHRCRNRAPHRRRKRKYFALHLHHILPIFLPCQPLHRCQQATLVCSERARRTRCLLLRAPTPVRRCIYKAI